MVILNIPDDDYFERTWWWLFRLNVPDDGYSERTWWWLFWTYLTMVIQAERTWWWLFRLNVPDDGYSECTWWWLFWTYLTMVIQAEHTRWWLFRLNVPDDGYSGWMYLMMVILNVPDDGYSRNVLCALILKSKFLFHVKNNNADALSFKFSIFPQFSVFFYTVHFFCIAYYA